MMKKKTEKHRNICKKLKVGFEVSKVITWGSEDFQMTWEDFFFFFFSFL